MLLELVQAFVLVWVFLLPQLVLPVPLLLHLLVLLVPVPVLVVVLVLVLVLLMMAAGRGVPPTLEKTNENNHVRDSTKRSMLERTCRMGSKQKHAIS